MTLWLLLLLLLLMRLMMMLLLLFIPGYKHTPKKTSQISSTIHYSVQFSHVAYYAI